MEARPDADDRPALVHGDRDAAAILLQGGIQGSDDPDVGVEILQLPVAGELDLEAVQVAGRRRQLGGRDLDVVEADDRVDLEGPEVEALADDLPMDLALGRDVDDRVAEEVRGAAQPAVVGEAAGRPVLALERVARR